MTVRIEKPEFNLREKLSELDKPVGVKGSELMRSETVEEARNFMGSGRKNLIINGGFDIWQRATDSGSNTSDGYLSADRWKHASSGATKQVTRQAFTLGQTEVPGNPRQRTPEKSFSEMTADEKRKNWKNIVEQYKPGN